MGRGGRRPGAGRPRTNWGPELPVPRATFAAANELRGELRDVRDHPGIPEESRKVVDEALRIALAILRGEIVGAAAALRLQAGRFLLEALLGPFQQKVSVSKTETLAVLVQSSLAPAAASAEAASLAAPAGAAPALPAARTVVPALATPVAKGEPTAADIIAAAAAESRESAKFGAAKRQKPRVTRAPARATRGRLQRPSSPTGGGEGGVGPPNTPPAPPAGPPLPNLDQPQILVASLNTPV